MGDREAILLSLLSRTFTEKTIVFYDTKAQAHRALLVLGLAGLKAAELHGNLTMTQRLEALDRFKAGEVQVLVATDLAARGLDITGVHTVINYEMPRSRDTYIHRVGRTARAGCGGRSVTLIGESRRLVMKDVLKIQAEKAEVKSRAVPQSVIDHYRSKIDMLEDEVAAIMREEKLEKEMRLAEMEADKAQNMIVHQDEITSRPAREWIMSKSRKEQIKEASVEQAKSQGGVKPLKANAASAEQGAKPPKEKSAKALEEGGHRLTRRKRRRIEARAAEAEEAEEARAAGKEAPPSDGQMRGMARAFKKEAREKKREYDNKPLSETTGIMRRLDISQDSGGAFDSDLKDQKRNAEKSSSKSAMKKGAKSAAGATGGKFGFSDFDPDKRLRRQGKQGRKQFKSKAKFKRKK
eukprot:TRINITY_DN3398_c0_g1_i1.p1 TRINITY_DN3398_c0_g1~~TRINITY_DN3398_c0_g1_i1.p1  ORF type:complete len:426 (-),score=147.73 TRINITY_DN3398_c0_g1_i1:22-1248(-)